MSACHHPRNVGDSGSVCRTCNRIRSIVQRVEREQERLNAHRLTLGQRIAAGLE